MATQSKWHLAVDSLLAVHHYNPENADMCNPKGAFVLPQYFVTATCPKGYIYAHSHATWDADEAQGWLASIERRVAAGCTLAPDTSPHWNYWRTCYGSTAHAIEGDAPDPVDPTDEMAISEMQAIDARIF